MVFEGITGSEDSGGKREIVALRTAAYLYPTGCCALGQFALDGRTEHSLRHLAADCTVPQGTSVHGLLVTKAKASVGFI